MTRRLAAAAALALTAAAVVLAAVAAVVAFPRGLVVLGCLGLAVAAGWYGLVRRGAARLAGLAAAAAAVVVAVVLVIAQEPLLTALSVLTLWLGLAATRVALRARVELPAVPPPQRAVLFYNPRSGGGKTARLRLADEARARGIRPIELSPGLELEALARDAVATGADGLAMAGGDGSQAIVAAVAAEHGLPYACVPAGTRNHFALDLGVDRDDVVGALDAFVDGGERVVDLAEANGCVFVNNVSLGLYAEAVQRPGYREAKLRTLLDTVPDVVGPRADAGLDLSWVGPGGHDHPGSAVILVSNNRYRLGRAIGSGTRPRLDGGELGITVFGTQDGGGHRGWREWTSPRFEVHSDRPVPAGIDGEAVHLDPPVRFRIHPAALRVRVAPRHPGASPSALQPDSVWGSVRVLAALVAARDVRPVPMVALPRLRRAPAAEDPASRR
jgi:diacylglycerol kinase family enzyme